MIIRSETELSVQFDQSIGSNATDPENYSISGGIGHPYSVIKVDDKRVDLRIPAATGNQLYTLTVNNIINPDGLAIDASGISMQFTGFTPPEPPLPPPSMPQTELKAEGQNINNLYLNESM